MNGSRGIGAAFVLGALLAGGLAVAGYLMGVGVGQVRAGERYVTVRGLAERELPANLAIWPLVYNTTGDDLAQLYASLDRDAETIARFLVARGFAAEEISRSAPRVTDFEAQSYGGNRPPQRYGVEGTVMLRTAKVGEVKAAMQASAELVREGITLIRSYEASPLFLFTELAAIKPEMIAEATRSAREAADQFAQDSASRISGIHRASQGLFQILPRDNAPGQSEELQLFKTVRVVTTVDYRLAD